jgi:hypothetical protein
MSIESLASKAAARPRPTAVSAAVRKPSALNDSLWGVGRRVLSRAAICVFANDPPTTTRSLESKLASATISVFAPPTPTFTLSGAKPGSSTYGLAVHSHTLPHRSNTPCMDAACAIEPTSDGPARRSGSLVIARRAFQSSPQV